MLTMFLSRLTRTGGNRELYECEVLRGFAYLRRVYICSQIVPPLLSFKFLITRFHIHQHGFR
jgi:hypothetical protein